jgi:hypothetical protein
MTRSFTNAGFNAIGTGYFYKDILDYPNLYMSKNRAEIEGKLDIFDWYSICHGLIENELYSKWWDRLGGGEL